MGCYHPLLAKVISRDPVTKKSNMVIVGSFDDFKDRITDQEFANHMKLPCGHCVGCRLDKSREWADRMIMELQHTKKAIFLTLTYSNEGLDEDNKERLKRMADDGRIWVEDNFYVPELSLRKRDMQLFMKRLRWNYAPTELRFYGSGEYGENTCRPHMHFIIFGLSLTDIPDLEFKFCNKFGDPIYASKKFENEIWQHGMVRIANVSWKTCAYVARYVMKKQYGDERNFYYELFDVEQPFSLMSRRPGIGAYYYHDLDKSFDPMKVQEIVMDNGVPIKISIPKFFYKDLVKYDRDTYNKIMEQRKIFALDREFLKLQKTDLSMIELIEREENEKAGVANLLKRPVDELL